MDEKYSKYINSKHGFVVAYHISKKDRGEDKLQVWTPTTKLSQPHEEKLTKERVSYFENRNKNQYQMIFENKDEIIKDKKRKVRSIVYPISGVLITLAGFLTSMNLPILYTMCCSVLGVSLVAFSEMALILVSEKLENELKTYQEFITSSKELEQRAEEDKNITSYLSENTNNLIQENKKLKEEGYIENVFNTHLMERMSLEELKELLLRYKMSKALEEPLTFRIPGAKTKKRTLTEKSK